MSVWRYLDKRQGQVVNGTDSLSGLTQDSDGPAQRINQISFHPLLTESHFEAQDYDQLIREPCPPCDTIRLDSTTSS
jgi:hypothetical protein